jgi:hypothetical protein
MVFQRAPNVALNQNYAVKQLTYLNPSRSGTVFVTLSRQHPLDGLVSLPTRFAISLCANIDTGFDGVPRQWEWIIVGGKGKLRTSRCT